MCGVRELDNSCSAHIVTGEQASEDQMAKQVTVASSTTPMERYEELYSVPYCRKETLNNKLLSAICEGKRGTEIITIPERIADVIFYKKEGHFLVENQNSIRQNQKRFVATVEQHRHYHHLS